MNNEIPHFHSIPVACTSDYLGPNMNTEKVPKFSNREKPSMVWSLKILQRVDVTPTLRMWEMICLNSKHVTRDTARTDIRRELPFTISPP